MGADQIAEIAPGVREVLDAAAQGREVMATFQLGGDATRWVQFTGGALNFAYPSGEDPASLPARLGVTTGALELVEWEAGSFATFNIERPLAAREIAGIIDAVFESVLGCAGRRYAVDVEGVEVDE